ncbi:hypothetical protein RJ640_016648 [Escallonia rubra]|uniref:Uncharacterized protein n=1 Tax=Escallonia rubra TaxID=112253 RepID=A0AA88RS13_9ASTE|nr:hypothetical protein RJ640_016648 [Escallonia rubra]
MRSFLRQETYVWYVVENGSIIPIKDGPNGTKIPKGILEMDTQEAHLFSMDDRAKTITSCGHYINEYNRVSASETAQEMWRLLEVTYEGTNQVKETKINILVQQYEVFKAKENESINEMYSRFIIYKWTQAFGESVPQKEDGCKRISNDSQNHDEIHDEEETTSKKKELALKVEVSHEPESSDDSDQYMAFITRKFKKFLASGEDIKEKKFKSRKALLTWDDSGESDEEKSEIDDVAQLCFMAKDVQSDEFDVKVSCAQHMQRINQCHLVTFFRSLIDDA